MLDLIVAVQPVKKLIWEIGLQSNPEGIGQIAKEVASVAVCVVAAVKLRCRRARFCRYMHPMGQVTRSLRWGTFVVTVCWLAILGILQYAECGALPSRFAFVLCVGLAAIILIGAKLEITGNIFIDSILASIGLSVLCFAVVNGAPLVPCVVSRTNACLWILLSTAASVVVRGILWAKEGE